jgi:endoglycosylceramidase
MQRRLRTVAAPWLAAALVAITLTAARAAPLEPVPPLAAAGRGLVDATGRVVMLHGVNEVAKAAPYYPAAAGFGDDDVAFLAAEGFNALRLGVDLRGLMPAPGVAEETYIDQLAVTVSQATAAGIFVLLDIHQDGFAPRYNGNGFPDWMALDDGLPNPPDAVFPLYYIQNPAMQRAFESFWANRAIPDGLGLQDYFMQALERVAARFGTDPMVLGTDLMNEPWPGATWQPCAAPGCPDLEASLLEPFYHRAGDLLRELSPRQLAFVEPFVLFNFGQAATSLPGADPGRALSFHSYAFDVTGERGVLAQAVAAAERDGAPLLLTEFGATSDPVVLNRLAAQFEEFRVPWMFWAYDEQIVRNRQVPLTPDVVNQPPLDALVRPYPVATAGVPTRMAFDPQTRVFELDYTTTPAAGGTFRRRADTLVFVPKRQYPDGYTVTVAGARVRSKACATALRLRTRRRGAPVFVRITPGVATERLRRRCGL